jgi:hypothetical protein
MKTIKFSEKINISSTQEIVFDYTQDYDERLHWDTFLKEARLMGGAIKADKGVRAYCAAKIGLGMETEYVSFNRPKVAAIKMTRGPFLFKSFSGSWTFNQFRPGITEVIFLYSFTLRFPFNVFTYFIKRNFQSNVRQRLLDLKRSIEKIT